MDWMIPNFTLKKGYNSIKLNNAFVRPGDTIAVSCRDVLLSRALAFSAFGFSKDAIDELGFTIDGISSQSTPLQGRQFISSNIWAEICGYWDTVYQEITLDGNLGTIDCPHIKAAIELLSLGTLLNRNPSELSGGETAKVILASHLAAKPSILVIDRIIDHFDISMRKRVIEGLAKVLPKCIFIFLEEECMEHFNKIWEIENNNVVFRENSQYMSRKHEDKCCEISGVMLKSQLPQNTDNKARLIIAKLKVVRNSKTVVNIGKQIYYGGNLIWIIGPNGSGKTSLIEACLGWLPHLDGMVKYVINEKEVLGNDVVAYSPQDPGPDITETTILGEVSLAMEKRLFDDSYNAEEWLTLHGLEKSTYNDHIVEDVALQKLGSVLAALARNRQYCFLDEPTALLSSAMRSVVVSALGEYISHGGLVLCATHDMAFYRMLGNYIMGTE
jgi:ABC-type Mn2+/Zn2+ transport system ATPase subunit